MPFLIFFYFFISLCTTISSIRLLFSIISLRRLPFISISILSPNYTLQAIRLIDPRRTDLILFLHHFQTKSDLILIIFFYIFLWLIKTLFNNLNPTLTKGWTFLPPTLLTLKCSWLKLLNLLIPSLLKLHAWI